MRLSLSYHLAPLLGAGRRGRCAFSAGLDEGRAGAASVACGDARLGTSSEQFDLMGVPFEGPPKPRAPFCGCRRTWGKGTRCDKLRDLHDRRRTEPVAYGRELTRSLTNGPRACGEWPVSFRRVRRLAHPAGGPTILDVTPSARDRRYILPINSGRNHPRPTAGRPP